MCAKSKAASRQKLEVQFRSYDDHVIDFDALRMSPARRGWTPQDVGETIRGDAYEGAGAQAWRVLRESRPFVYLPQAIAYLVGQDQWSSIVACEAWDRRHRRVSIGKVVREQTAWPPHEWLDTLRQNDQIGAIARRPDLPFEPRHADSLRRLLLRCSPTLLEVAARDGGDESDAKFMLEECALRLEAHAGLVEAYVPEAKADADRIKADKICRNHAAVVLLRDRGSLFERLKNCLLCGLPLAKRIAGLKLLDHVHCRDQGSSSRDQIKIDTAYCAYWKKVCAADSGPIYLWADSSPQLGTDWLLSTALWIRDENLLECMDAVHILNESKSYFDHEQDDEDVMMEWTKLRNECGATLRDCMQLHSQIPMGLGSGSSSLLMKLKCLAQKTFIECQSLVSMSSTFSRIKAFCVDMGTEVGMADVHGLEAADLLPRWMRSGASLFPDEVAPSGSQFVFPAALLSPGTCHIFNNLCADVDQALTQWRWWMDGFKCISYLLAKDTWATNVILGHNAC